MNLTAEQSVLGAIMLNPQAFEGVDELISSSMFQGAGHGIIYEEIARTYKSGGEIDPVGIAEKVKAHVEFAYVLEMVRDTISPGNAVIYAGIVAEQAKKRAVLRIADSMARMIHENEPLDDVLKISAERITEIETSKVTAEAVHVKSLLGKVVDYLDQRFQSGGRILGISTGITELDECISGLCSSNLIIIAGRPSMGKTTLAMNISEQVAMAGRRVLFASYEMPDVSLILRALSSISGVSHEKVRHARFDESDWAAITAAVGKLADSGLHISDYSGESVASLRAKAKAMAKTGLDLIVIDYLQLMQGVGDNATEKVSEISGSLKNLAKELRVPVICLSQLNRSLEQRPNKRPILSDLRQSGAIEQDADAIIFVYRDEVYDENSHDKGIAEIIVAKNRDGEKKTIRVYAELEKSRFRNLDYIYEEKPIPPPKQRKYEYT